MIGHQKILTVVPYLQIYIVGFFRHLYTLFSYEGGDFFSSNFSSFINNIIIYSYHAQLMIRLAHNHMSFTVSDNKQRALFGKAVKHIMSLRLKPESRVVNNNHHFS
jgi:hypothetical protein